MEFVYIIFLSIFPIPLLNLPLLQNTKPKKKKNEAVILINK